MISDTNSTYQLLIQFIKKLITSPGCMRCKVSVSWPHNFFQYNNILTSQPLSFEQKTFEPLKLAVRKYDTNISTQ